MIADGHTTIEHSLPVPHIYNDVLQFWRGSKTAWTPTLIVAYGGPFGEYHWYQHNPAWLEPIEAKWTPQGLLDARARRPTIIPDDEDNIVNVARQAKQISDLGIPVSIGAHGQREGLGAHWEIWGFALGGMSNMEALRTATINPARAHGLDHDLGSIEPGKLADLVVLDKNPLDDIHNTTSIRYTMINGMLLDSDLNAVAGGTHRTRPFWFQQSAGGELFAKGRRSASRTRIEADRERCKVSLTSGVAASRESGLSGSRRAMSDKDPSLRRNAPKLALHVPEPPFRPGDTPDFSSLKIPAAGRRAAPDTNVPAAETHPLTTALVRVLGDDNKAVGPWDPKLDPDTLRKMLRDMVTVRIFDDRMYRAQRQGKTSFYMKCTGEEAIAVAAAAALDRDDMHFPTYRQQGLLDRARLSADGDDVPDLFEQRRQAEGPPAADHVFGQGARLLLDLGQSRDAIPAGGRLGDGRGDQGRQPHLHGLGRRRRDRRGRLPQRDDLRRGLQRAGHPRGGQQPVGDLELLRNRRRRARDLRAARGRLWHRRAAGRRQ